MEVNWDTARWSCLALLLRNSVVINCVELDGWLKCEEVVEKTDVKH